MFIAAAVLAASLVNAPLSVAYPLAPQDQKAPAAAQPAETIPAATFTKNRPAEAKHLKDVKALAAKGEIKKGDTVTIQGRIAGRKEPFVKGRAMFLLADQRLVACNEKPDDVCATPWDLCCESPDSLKANTATIQILGPNGKALKVSAENVAGLKPLAKLVVVGTVAEATKEGAFVISATSIFVEPAEAKKDGAADGKAAPNTGTKGKDGKGAAGGSRAE